MIRLLPTGLVMAAVMVCVPRLAAQDEPKDSPAFTRLGVMTIREGRYDEGIKALDKAIKLDAKNGLAYYWRGRANTSLGNLKEAVADFDEAIRLSPTDPTAYVQRAAAKKEMGDAAGAAEDMKKATALGAEREKPKPESAKGKEVSLIDLTAKLVELPEDAVKVEQLLQKAVQEVNEGKFEAAIKNLDAAIKIDPKQFALYLQRGIAKTGLAAATGNNDPKQRVYWLDAVMDYSKAIEYCPKSARAYYRRAAAKVALAQYKSALEDIEKAIALNPALEEELRLHAERIKKLIPNQ